MDLFTARRLAAEAGAELSGRRFSGLSRLDPRRLAIRFGDRRWMLLLDEALCGAAPLGEFQSLRERTTPLDYVDEALTGFELQRVSAEPGRLRFQGANRAGALELVVVGPPRSFLMVLSGDQPIAGYRRPLEREWTALLPTYDPAATEAAPSTAILERWREDHPEPMRDTALARLGLALNVPLAREARFRAGSDEPAAVAAAAREVLEEATGGGLVRVYPPGERPLLVTCAELRHEPRACECFPSVSEAVAVADARYLEPARLGRLRRAAARPLEVRRGRAEAALRSLAAERLEVEGRAVLEREAHILMAHGARLPRGLSETRLPDLEDPERAVRIELDPMKTGMENATARIRRASKMERRAQVLEGRVADVTRSLREAGEAAERILLSADWAALEALGVLAGERAAPESTEAREATSRGEPLRVVSEEGWDILIGRNDRQNEYITHRLARSEDLWFHAEHVPGSHVLLRRAGRKGEPSARTLQEVAGFAAWMSKARSSSDVPVIVTEKRFVRKARGGPGKVTVDRAHSLIVTPRKPAAGMAGGAK